MLNVPWIVAHQAPLSMEFSRQVYWSGLPCPRLRDLPDPGIELMPHISCVGRGVLYTSAAWEAQKGMRSDIFSLVFLKFQQEVTLQQEAFFIIEKINILCV